MLLRAGSILPIVSESNLPSPLNTNNLRKVPLELWVLHDEDGTASGELFYDDGDSIDTIQKGAYNLYEFKFSQNKLTIKAKNHGHQASNGESLKIDKVRFALNKPVASATVTLNGARVPSSIDGGHVAAQINLDLLARKPEVTIQVEYKFQ